jgi:hypothetical protein
MTQTPAAGRYPKSNRHGAEGSIWRRVVKAVVSRDHGLCAICNHPGAESADHVIPVTERPDLALNTANLQATHSKPCPICTEAALANGWDKPIRCNYIKNSGSIDRARRLIEERTGLKLTDTQEATPDQDGRPW